MKKSIKKLSVMIFATGMILSSTFTSLAAWEQQPDGAWKYKDDTTNVYVTATWIESATESGVWYYLDQNGVMATNTLINNQYYVNGLGEWRESGSSNEVALTHHSENTNSVPNSGSQSQEDNSRGGLGAPGQVGESQGMLLDPEIVQGIGEGLYR